MPQFIEGQQIDVRADAGTAESWQVRTSAREQQYAPELTIVYPTSAAGNLPKIENRLVKLTQQVAGGDPIVRVFDINRIRPESVIVRNATDAVAQVATANFLTPEQIDRLGAFGFWARTPDIDTSFEDLRYDYTLPVDEKLTLTNAERGARVIEKINNDPNGPLTATYDGAANGGNGAFTLTARVPGQRIVISSVGTSPVTITVNEKVAANHWSNFKFASYPSGVVENVTWANNKALRTLTFVYDQYIETQTVFAGGSSAQATDETYLVKPQKVTVVFDPDTTTSLNAYTALYNILTASGTPDPLNYLRVAPTNLAASN